MRHNTLLHIGALLLFLTGCAAAVTNTPTSTDRSTSTVTAVAPAVAAVPDTTSPAATTTTQPTLTNGVDADGYHTLGDPTAPVTLTDYSDYF